MLIGGIPFRLLEPAAWDVSTRLADMASMGVASQVLSPMPELMSYWLDPAPAAALSSFVNDSVAGMVAAAPDCFHGLGTVPLQDLELAIRELDRTMHVLRLCGVQVGSNVNGIAIGHPSFRPFFEAAQDWQAAVFVHAVRPALDRLVGPPALEQALAFPGEIGLGGASLITGGTLAALPSLRVALSHGGGSLPVLVARLQHAWTVQPALRESLPMEPRSGASRMFYDNLLYDGGLVRELVAQVGCGQVLIGSDYPFAIMEPDPAGSVAGLDLPPHERAALARLNPRRWLGLPDR
jgi:aminocarboxymuconate-semialdehyde decarboxylase